MDALLRKVSVGRFALCGLYLLGIPGCYLSHGVGVDAGADARAPMDAPLAVIDGGPCADFPRFDRRCTTVSECSVGFHQVDCCGSVEAWGVAERERAAFSEREVACRVTLPDCDCPPRPVLADDGSVAVSMEVPVACLDGICTTSFADD